MKTKDIAYGLNPGFENNEGGYGTILVGFLEDTCLATYDDPDAEPQLRLRVEHHEIIQDTNDYEYDL